MLVLHLRYFKMRSVFDEREVLGSASGGQIGTLLGGIQVLINGVPAPLLSAGPNQIRAVVPFEAGPSVLTQTGLANIQILDGSTTVQPFTVPIAALAPSIFTVDGRPSGQALMINEDGTKLALSNRKCEHGESDLHEHLRQRSAYGPRPDHRAPRLRTRS